MEKECEALPGVAYPGVRDNRSTINTKTGYDDDDDIKLFCCACVYRWWTFLVLCRHLNIIRMFIIRLA